MNENTEKLIQELAAKFGTTAEHLWGVLVRQAPISSAMHVGCWIVAVSVFVYAHKRINKTNEEEARFVARAIWCIGALIFTCMAYDDLPEILAGFFNPEYWALKQLLP